VPAGTGGGFEAHADIERLASKQEPIATHHFCDKTAVVLPFSSEQFCGVFADYNELFWPVAVLLWIASAFVLADRLRAIKSDRLEDKKLDAARRAVHRKAAPFSRGTPRRRPQSDASEIFSDLLRAPRPITGARGRRPIQ
jgi:hypothetical protein